MNTYKQEFLVSSYDLNPRGEARFTSLANYFQEVAYQHASILGLGFQDLIDREMIWVLSRLKVEVKRYPLWNETIEMETWPSGIEKLFAMRQFRIRDQEGEELACGESAWLILNSRTHRLVRPTEVIEVREMPLSTERVFPEPMEKLQLPDEMEQRSKQRVSFSDLDINSHTNNVKYMEWCIDALYANQQRFDPIREMEINFSHETRHGEEIGILASADRGEGTCFVARRENDAAEIIRARIRT